MDKLEGASCSQKTEDLNTDGKEVEKSEENQSDDEEKENGGMINLLQSMFAKRLHVEKGDVGQVLDEVSFDGIVRYIKNEKCKNIIAMVGAGISTSAGIPDFRSPGSGIYSNLQKYNLPSPNAMFEINFFKENPEPFFDLAKELCPGKFKPTPCHYFLQLLNQKNLLKRLYTQNIDTLERIAGIPGEKLVEAHGTFFISHCIRPSCRKEYSLEWMKDKIQDGSVPRCTKCKSVVKPDIVFFGENLPELFFQCVQEDFMDCDLLIIIGTSLTVQPFAGLIDEVSSTTPRLLINKEKCGKSGGRLAQLVGMGGGMDFDSDSNYRDVCWLGLCDEGCQKLADALGWGDELRDSVRDGHEKIDREKENTKPKE